MDLIMQDAGRIESGNKGIVYEDDGNLLQDGWTNQTWDGQNRMISRSPRWQTVNDFRWAYDYDFRGRRVKMVGELWTGSVWQHYMTETFLYDGWSVACSYAKFGTDSTWHKRSYTWGLDLSGSLQGAGGVGGLLALNGWYYPGSSGAAKWVYCYDGNGNVTQLLGTSGTHVILGAHYEYDAFGQITASPNPWAYWTNIAWSNPFRFSTKFLSAWNRRGYEYNIAWHNMDYYWLRWYDYGYRWYDPMKGRWASRDPIGEEGGRNRFVFVANHPTITTDIRGLCKLTIENPHLEIPERFDQGFDPGKLLPMPREGLPPHIQEFLSREGIALGELIFVNKMGQATRDVATLSCECNYASMEIECILTMNRPIIVLRADAVPGDLYHEQRHLNAIQKMLKELVTDPIRSSTDCACFSGANYFFESQFSRSLEEISYQQGNHGPHGARGTLDHPQGPLLPKKDKDEEKLSLDKYGTPRFGKKCPPLTPGVTFRDL